MKKFPPTVLIASAALAIVLGAPYFAYAQPLQQKFRQNYDSYTQNLRNNEDYRNDMLKRSNGLASSTNLQNLNPKIRLMVQLVTALDNLRQVRGRMADRIDVETSNDHDMTEATSLLAVADTKIDIASKDIHTFVSFTSATSTTLSTTSRDLASTTISAIEDARGALNAVLSAIAHALGISLTDATASSSPQ